jgi:hypothetical protein
MRHQSRHPSISIQERMNPQHPVTVGPELMESLARFERAYNAPMTKLRRILAIPAAARGFQPLRLVPESPQAQRGPARPSPDSPPKASLLEASYKTPGAAISDILWILVKKDRRVQDRSVSVPQYEPPLPAEGLSSSDYRWNTPPPRPFQYLAEQYCALRSGWSNNSSSTGPGPQRHPSPWDA